MLAFNEIARDEAEKPKEANQGKLGEICFATMTSGVRTPSGPPSNTFIHNNLNEISRSELRYGIPPWGLDSNVYSKRPENIGLAISSAVRVEHLEILCPFLALLTRCQQGSNDSDA